MHLPWDILSASGGLVAIAKLAHACREHVKKHELHGSISSGGIHAEYHVGKVPQAPSKKSIAVR